MKKVKFIHYSKTEIPVEENPIYYNVVIDDPIQRRIELEKKRLNGEKELIDFLKSAPVASSEREPRCRQGLGGRY